MAITATGDFAKMLKNPLKKIQCSGNIFFFPISILEKQDVLKTSICKENCTVGEREKHDILKSCFDVATQAVRRTDGGAA